MYKNPFQLLDLSHQYQHESPIQFFLGFLFFSWASPAIAYLSVQLIGVIYLIYCTWTVANLRSVNNYNFFWVFALSPSILVLFNWFGKSDIFLMAAFFGIYSSIKNSLTIFIHVIVSIFSHIQMSIFHIIFLFFLKIIRINELKIKSVFAYLFAFFIYFLYMSSFGEFGSRSDFISSRLPSIINGSLNNPVITLFCTFNWLWILVFNVRDKLKLRFWIIFILILFISFATKDFTRVFILTALPLLIEIINLRNLERALKKIGEYIPLSILIFIQFQKIPGGKIVDSA